MKKCTFFIILFLFIKILASAGISDSSKPLSAPKVDKGAWVLDSHLEILRKSMARSYEILSSLKAMNATQKEIEPVRSQYNRRRKEYLNAYKNAAISYRC